MISLPLPPKVIQKKKNQAVFEIEGLYPGYGVTIGNALRRVLLSSLQGAAVTEIKIKGVPHEFSTMPGILEDGIMILLNVKNLRFKIFEGDSHKVELKVKGDKVITGGDLKVPSQLKIVNPESHIATITDKNTEFEMELLVEKGIGYEPKDRRKNSSTAKKAEIGSIALDAIFSPIRNVNFQIENMRVGDRTDFDKLNLEIETDGTIAPEEAFFEACDILLKHFNIIFSGNPEGKDFAKANNDDVKKDEQEKEADIVGDPLKTSVEDIKLTGRTLNVLLKNNIKNVGQIIKKSENDLLELEGMGEKALSEIKRKIKKIGLNLK
jgi:DNA-directed RNA polymerase subunit alpha